MLQNITEYDRVAIYFTSNERGYVITFLSISFLNKKNLDSSRSGIKNLL